MPRSEPPLNRVVRAHAGLKGYTNNCISIYMKPLQFIGTSLDDLRAMPADVRQAMGIELRVDLEIATHRYRSIQG